MSVGNALRSGLAAVLKSRVPSSVPWRARLVAALESLGAGDTATHMMKYIERQEWKERRWEGVREGGEGKAVAGDGGGGGRGEGKGGAGGVRGRLEREGRVAGSWA